MTENRSETILPDGRFDIGNYIRADSALAARWNREEPKPDGRSWTAQDVNRWRKKNKLSPHECSDMETVQYVPKDIHSYFKHYGGVAECKARNAIERGVVENAM